MANPKLPIEIKKARGTLNTTRDKNYLTITKDSRIMSQPLPPGYFNDFALHEWDIVWQHLIEYELATVVDESLIAAYCQEMGTYLSIQQELNTTGHTYVNSKGVEVVHPLYRIGNKSLSMAIKIAQEFGFTPVARSRVIVHKPESQKTGGDSILSLIDR